MNDARKNPTNRSDLERQCVHVTTVHPRHDPRILYRECTTLSEAGFNVTLMIADGKGDETINGVQITDIGKSGGGRVGRFLWTDLKMTWRLFGTSASLYHFHDPELIICATILRWRGKTVVFDVHENIAAQIKNKPYLNTYVAHALSKAGKVLNAMIKKCHGIVIAEHSYANLYLNSKGRCETVLNLPRIEHFSAFLKTDRSQLPNGILYVGGVSQARGYDVMMKALTLLDQKGVSFTFHVVGRFDDQIERAQFEHGEVIFHGYLPIAQAYETSMQCRVGVSILQPIPNYIESYSTKIFEYMSIGLPFIASNFPIYVDIENECGAGLCVDPANPTDVANAIETIFTDNALANSMSSKGIAATREKWNWASEGKKLIELYRALGVPPHKDLVLK